MQCTAFTGICCPTEQSTTNLTRFVGHSLLAWHVWVLAFLFYYIITYNATCARRHSNLNLHHPTARTKFNSTETRNGFKPCQEETVATQITQAPKRMGILCRWELIGDKSKLPTALKLRVLSRLVFVELVSGALLTQQAMQQKHTKMTDLLMEGSQVQSQNC